MSLEHFIWSWKSHENWNREDDEFDNDDLQIKKERAPNNVSCSAGSRPQNLDKFICYSNSSYYHPASDIRFNICTKSVKKISLDKTVLDFLLKKLKNYNFKYFAYNGQKSVKRCMWWIIWCDIISKPTQALSFFLLYFILFCF